MILPTPEEFEKALNQMDQGKLSQILDKMADEMQETELSRRSPDSQDNSFFSLYLLEDNYSSTSTIIAPNWQTSTDYSKKKIVPETSLVKGFMNKLSTKGDSQYFNLTSLNKKNKFNIQNDSDLETAS